MKSNKITVGITQGDINGVGYEVIIKSLMDNRIFDLCTPIVYGSPKVGAYHRKALNISNFSFNNIKSPEEANIKRANIINCLDDNIRVELGKSTKAAGEASLESLKKAVDDLKNNKIDIIVTAPINKDNIQSEKFKFPGHTEFFTEQFESKESLMLLASDMMKIGVVTGHVPIKKVPEYITIENILKKLSILNNSLVVDFNIRKPRIAVFGLNPHSGDNGVIGDEEQKIITPALKKAREEDIVALGPFSADGFFAAGYFTKFDAILAMYHDQGLAPFKALEFDKGVNFTAGLPIVRTSPAHGTAFEIAGKNQANADSFRSAIYMACDIYKNRKEYYELTKNQIKNYTIPEG